MIKQRPIVLHFYEDELPMKLPDFFTKTFEIISIPLHDPLVVSEYIVGIIVDVSTLSIPLCDLLVSHNALVGNMGICLCTESFDPKLAQILSLETQTFCFERAVLRDTDSSEWKKLEHAFLAIGKRNHYNTAVMRSSTKKSVLDTLQIVAHQWRQPINLISMEAINMMVLGNIDKTVKSVDVLKSSEFISQQVLRMSDILKSILNMGKDERIKQLFTIHELSSSIQAFFAEQFQKEEIELVVDILDDGIEIYGFKTDLEEVLINLINNARDAYIGNKITGQKSIIFQAEVDNGSYLFCIRDEAGGIPEEIRKKIFEPKFSTKDKGVGFGIGLHFAQLTIETEFGGSLTLQPYRNGSEFQIRLPQNDLSNLTFIH
ncbi:HAMP domain-containing sensor histidine kinase [Sulfuricurvum sp.]|uniref:sensor histidine kinase n=1 Tax=Sulfuricurvum sp. TaxID=2025608 RepID=UPI0025E6F05D|nr:HAMP domain-containing sensor histidine kinase [Sulfuricurvum sp.]